jgi:microcystin-dependent protein
LYCPSGYIPITKLILKNIFMADTFVAEVRIFPFNFPPRGWAFCDGQLMPISQNTALFSLLGTTYGGDGKSTFALPDLQGRAALQPGQGPGLSFRDLGEQSGTETVTLLVTEMPAHTHVVNAKASGGTASPTGFVWGTSNAQKLAANFYAPAAAAPVNMNAGALSAAGSGFPHNNMMPYLTLNFCIAMQGVFPQRP